MLEKNANIFCHQMWSYPAESTARDALFDGGGMADKGVVFVNYNYRTGSFGWLATPELSAENLATVGHNSSGNWGMLDQFAALKWIKANIANFGGKHDQIYPLKIFTNCTFFNR